MAGMREAHLRDAVALAEFLQQVEAKVGVGGCGGGGRQLSWQGVCRGVGQILQGLCVEGRLKLRSHTTTRCSGVRVAQHTPHTHL